MSVRKPGKERRKAFQARKLLCEAMGRENVENEGGESPGLD